VGVEDPVAGVEEPAAGPDPEGTGAGCTGAVDGAGCGFVEDGALGLGCAVGAAVGAAGLEGVSFCATCGLPLAT
jgi:hypothetical protein